MWQFVLTNNQGIVEGEAVNASARKVVLPHQRVPSATFTLPMHDHLAEFVMDYDALLKVYRTDPVTGTRTLVFNGPVVSAEENAEETAKSVAVTASGPFWRLSKRIIPASKVQTGAQYGNVADLVDLGEIAHMVLDDVNTQEFSGIGLGTQADSTDAWVGKWFLKNAAEAIVELSAGLNSFEWRVRPTETTDIGEAWPQLGLFDVAPIIGQSRPDAIFEYGSGQANVASYRRTVSREAMLTNGLMTPSGWPDSVEKWDHDSNPATAPVDKYHMVEFEDGTARIDRGRFEEVLPDPGILDDDLRADLIGFHVAIRKQPRQIIVFKPAINARPSPLTDYEVGDTIRARAVVNGNLRFDANFRIWGITFDVDQNGNENVELELVMP